VGDAEMIAGRRFLACQHHVAETVAQQAWRHALDALAFVPPDERPATDLRAGRGDVESERIGLAGGDARLALSRAQAPAGAGIDLPLEAVRGMAGGGDLRLDLSARAEAGIEQAALLQCFERGGVVAEMLRLDPHRLLPAQAQPGEVLEDRGGVFRAAARDVDILDAQQETTAGFSGAR